MRIFRSSPAVLAALLVAGVLAACTQGARSGRRAAPDAVRGDYASGGVATDAPRASPVPREDPDDAASILRKKGPEAIPGTPSIRILWEALAVEEERFRQGEEWRLKNGKSTRPNVAGITDNPEFEVILLGASFRATPDQDRENRGVRAIGRVARLSDADALDLVAGLERVGFFKYAQPTSAVRHLFGSDRARGRVTVDRGGESHTLLSMRGLGLQESTKGIPEVYAQSKTAIQLMKNRVGVLRVKTSGAVDTARPRYTPPPPPPPASPDDPSAPPKTK